MKEILRTEKFCFTYAGSKNEVLQSIDLKINSGEIVLVCGKSGSGKTTLLKFIKQGSAPKGEIRGKIEYGFSEKSFVGYLPQNAEDGIVTDKVWHELAFGLENQGKSQDYIRRKVAEAVSFFGLTSVYDKEISTLSGGMKQLVLLASIMVMEPEILILDEPVSQLDPITATDFLAMLKRIHSELGTTIVISEHRLTDLMEMSDRLLVLDEGKILYDGMPENVTEYYLKPFKEQSGNKSDSYGDAYELLPPSIKICSGLGGKGAMPLNVTQCRKWLKEEFFSLVENEENIKKTKDENIQDNIKTDADKKALPEAVIIKNLTFSFGKKGEYVLHKLNMSVKEGEIHAVLGANGSGKTTLLSCISGVYDNYTGKISTGGRRVVLMPQNPRLMFVKESIKEDFEVLKKIHKGQVSDEDIISMVRAFKIEHVLDRYVYDLSGGEVQKAAMVKILLTKPDIILLDEPAKGMDGAFKREFAEILKSLVKQGKTIITVSHDIEFAAHCADRCTLLFNGDAAVTEVTSDFFSGNTFYTTAASRISSGFPDIDGSVTEEEIIKRLSNRIKDFSDGKTIPNRSMSDKDFKNVTKEPTLNSGINGTFEIKKTCETNGSPGMAVAQKYDMLMIWLTILSVFVLIPFTIWFGTVKLEDRKYFFISLLVLVEALLPVFILYEFRQTDLVRLVTDAVLCAITVTGRAVFYMLPNFKPVIALVTISGIAMGPFDGFVIGAVSMLVSDMFFGQGPWTPWQMLAMGLVGLISGFFGKIRAVKEKTGLLCLLGAILAIVVFGGIMNPASIIMYQPEINMKMLVFSYATGFPVDCVQAIATVIFLALGAKPFLRKLERLNEIN